MPRTLPRASFAAAALVLLAGGVAAQGVPSGYAQRSWTVEDGLPVNQITGLVQGRHGYLWLSTFDGLVRFDGVRFTTFNTGNSPGLPSNRITNLTVASVVKLLSTVLTLALLVLAGKRFYPITLDVHLTSFTLALVVSTVSILSVGFVIASIVPTARFAQPIGSAILYPMLAVSGIFVPLEAMSRGWHTLGSVLPVTHAVTLLRGAWAGESWFEHLPSLGVLALTVVICTALSAKIFRWE